MEVVWKNGSPTGAGRVTKREKAKDWVCPVCSASLRYWWVKCPNDFTPRPA